MADSGTTPLTGSPAVSDANQDDGSRLLLGFLHYQRDSVLKIVEGLPEEAWQTPVVAVRLDGGRDAQAPRRRRAPLAPARDLGRHGGTAGRRGSGGRGRRRVRSRGRLHMRLAQ